MNSRQDGIPDIVISKSCDGSNCPAEEGSVSVYSGSDFSLIFKITGTGWSDAIDAGDLNGDGVSDLVVNESFPAENVRAYSGSDGSPIPVFTGKGVTTGFKPGNNDQGANNGSCGSPVSVGDLNGDGKAEWAVISVWASPGGRTHAGTIYVLDGNTGAPMPRMDGQGPMKFEGESPGDYLGGEPSFECGWLSVVGDLNGDGYPDFMTGAVGVDVNGISEAGRALVFSGYDASVLLRIDNPDPGASPHYFGVDGAVVGEASGQEPVRVVIGAGDPFFGSPEVGSAYLFPLILSTSNQGDAGPKTRIVAGGNQTWTTNSPRELVREKLTAGAFRGNIYAITDNGDLQSVTIEIYDPVMDTWRKTSPMVHPRKDFAIGVVGGFLFVAGGFDANGPTAVVEVYDPMADRWTMKTPMPTARAKAVMGVVNDFPYVVGGTDGRRTLTAVESYDAVTDTWFSKASVPRVDPTIAVSNGTLYAMWERPGGGYLIESLDSMGKIWVTKTPVLTSRIGATLGNEHGALYLRGADLRNPAVETAEAYDPVSDKWNRGTP